MLSSNYTEKDVEEETPPLESRKWMTTVVVHMQPIAPYSPESPAADAVLQAFEAIVQNVMTEHGAKTEGLGQDTLAGVFRGTGENVQDAWKGIQAAFAIMEKLGEQNRQRRSQNRFPIRVGIGVHSGPSPQEAPAEHFSALTKNVSKAEGLSILNRQTPFPSIFISKNTLRRLDGGRGYHIQPLGEAALHNQGEPTPVYAMMHAIQLA